MADLDRLAGVLSHSPSHRNDVGQVVRAQQLYPARAMYLSQNRHVQPRVLHDVEIDLRIIDDLGVPQKRSNLSRCLGHGPIRNMNTTDRGDRHISVAIDAKIKRQLRNVVNIHAEQEAR